MLLFKICAPLLLLSLAPAQGDWPTQFGPAGTNISSAEGLLKPWPESGPPRAWKIKLGKGFGSASVVGEEVFLLDRNDSEEDVLRVFALQDGSELWSVSYPAPGRLSYAGSRCAPNVTAERVYAVGGFGQLSAFDRQTKKLAWQVDFEKKYDASLPGWGWAQTPLLWKDTVIVAPMGKSVGLAAFDAASGEERWHTPALGNSHSTPVLLNLHGVPQVLFLTSGRLSAFNPEDGSELWWTDAYDNRIPIPPPVVLPNNRLLVSGGYEAGSIVLAVTLEEQKWQTQVIQRWKIGTQIHPPILYKEKIFLLANENANDKRTKRSEGGLACFDLQGDELWRTGDKPYFERGGMILADGQLLIMDGLSGELYQVEASGEAYREIARFDPWEKAGQAGNNWAPLSLAHGRLLARTQEELGCFDLRVTKR